MPTGCTGTPNWASTGSCCTTWAGSRTSSSTCSGRRCCRSCAEDTRRPRRRRRGLLVSTGMSAERVPHVPTRVGDVVAGQPRLGGGALGCALGLHRLVVGRVADLLLGGALHLLGLVPELVTGAHRPTPFELFDSNLSHQNRHETLCGRFRWLARLPLRYVGSERRVFLG